MASLCGDLDRHPIKHAHEGMKLHVEFRRFPGWIRFGQFPERVVIFCFHQCFTDQSGTGKPCFWGTFATAARAEPIAKLAGLTAEEDLNEKLAGRNEAPERVQKTASDVESESTEINRDS